MNEKKTSKDSDSVPSLRDQMIETLTAKEAKAMKREITVMTRLSKDLVTILDNLVRLGIFKSRSEAAAAIIERALLSQRELFSQLEDQIEKLEKIRGTAMDIVSQALSEEP